MKASNFIIGAGVAMLLTAACSTSRTAGVGVYYDDIYYVPGENRDRPEKMFSEVPAMSNEALKAEKKELAAQRREYETNSQTQEDARDFSAIQEEYTALLGDENYTEVDTLLYYNDETGYWVDEFNGSQMDRDYAERLIRFHGPAIRIPYHSPFYSEVVYFNHYDWNVYVDGHYAYAFPTWTNRWYDYYHYDSWYRPYGWNFGWNWGYGYNNWYFGYGWSYPYYGYGWNYPYYGWNHHHHWGDGNWAYYDRNVYRGPRTGMGSSTRPSRGLRDDVRSSTRERGTVSAASRQGTRSSQDVRGTGTARTRESVTTRENAGARQSTATRASYGREVADANGSRTSRQTTARTRNSYTPSYTTPEGNTRPSYNRATYSRDNAGTRQSTGTVQGSSSTGTRQSAPSSTSSPSYNGGARQSSSSATRPSSTISRPNSSSTYQRGSSSSSSSRSYSGSSSSRRPSSSYSGGSRSSSSYSGGSSRSSSYSGGSSSSRSSGGSYSGGSSSGGSSRSSGGGGGRR